MTDAGLGTVPMLMYHALSGPHTPGFRRWTLPADRFEAHLAYLSEHGYRSVTVAELAGWRRHGWPATGARLVALTFDDAYADFHEVALPLLIRYGLTATLFVPTGHVGGRSRWMAEEGEGDRAILSWGALAEIAACGIEIGAHSHTHPELDRLPARDLAMQVQLPKALAEDRLGVPVRCFAYPYGHYDSRVRRAVAEAGYSGGCTMNSWAATATDHPLELPRTAVFDSTDVAKLAAGLEASRSRGRRTVLRARQTASVPARRMRTWPGRTPGGTAMTLSAGTGARAAGTGDRRMRPHGQLPTDTEDTMAHSTSRPRPIRVCYYLQTHTRPGQVSRLVEVIKEGSPDSVVLISHDAAAPPLDVQRLESMPGVHVLIERGGYGDYSHLERYFAAIDWLDAQGIEYDWLENISGQDYPLRPIADLESTLAASEVDGYLLYAPIFPGRLPAGADQGAWPQFELVAPFDAGMRYQYRHWWVGRPTSAKQRWLRPLMALNFVQPWVRVSLPYSTIGVRRRSTIFSDDFVAYGGWFFCTLSRPCVQYVRDFVRDHPDMVRFFRTVLAPEEAFLQTVLVNSGKFRFEPDSKRYIDMTGSRNNHSRTLGVADLDAALASEAHWARKFDLAHDAEVFGILDRHIGRRPQ